MTDHGSDGRHVDRSWGSGLEARGWTRRLSCGFGPNTNSGRVARPQLTERQFPIWRGLQRAPSSDTEKNAGPRQRKRRAPKPGRNSGGARPRERRVSTQRRGNRPARGGRAGWLQAAPACGPAWERRSARTSGCAAGIRKCSRKEVWSARAASLCRPCAQPSGSPAACDGAGRRHVSAWRCGAGARSQLPEIPGIQAPVLPSFAATRPDPLHIKRSASLAASVNHIHGIL